MSGKKEDVNSLMIRQNIENIILRLKCTCKIIFRVTYGNTPNRFNSINFQIPFNGLVTSGRIHVKILLRL